MNYEFPPQNVPKSYTAYTIAYLWIMTLAITLKVQKKNLHFSDYPFFLLVIFWGINRLGKMGSSLYLGLSASKLRGGDY